MTIVQIVAWLLKGLGTTALVSLFAAMVALPFGFVFGILQYHLKGSIVYIVTGIVEFWRSSSLVILLFFFYYALPGAGIQLGDYTVSALVLGCNAGAYGAYSFSSALASVGSGQSEAGLSLGLSRSKVLLLIQCPQALQKIYPIIGNDVIELIKTSAIVSVIGLADITYRAKEVLQFSYRPAAIFISLMMIYVAICAPLGAALRQAGRPSPLRGR